MSDVVDSLGDVNVHDRVSVELDDGSSIEGVAAPVDFDSNERLRIEIRPDEGNDRYELSATVDDGEWSPVGVRRQAGDEDWESIGEVTAVTHGEEDQFDDSASGGDEP